MSAIAGTYQNVKFLTTVGVARVSIDVYMSDWEKYSSVLGNPPSQDGTKKYVAITQITESAFKEWAAKDAGLGPREESTGVAKLVDARDGAMEGLTSIAGSSPATGAKRERKLSEIAFLKCRDEEFQGWIIDQPFAMAAVNARGPVSHSMFSDNIAIADFYLKAALGIASKTELDTNPTKAQAFDRLLTDYSVRNLVRS